MEHIIDQTIYYNLLLDTYGEILTDTQKEVLESYYSLNLSISEIASERNISRAAVEDTIKKATKKLEFYEEKLGFAGKNKEIKEALKDLRELELGDEANQIIDFIDLNL